MTDISDIYDDTRKRLVHLASENAGWSVGEFQGIPFLISPPTSANQIVANAVAPASIAVPIHRP